MIDPDDLALPSWEDDVVPLLPRPRMSGLEWFLASDDPRHPTFATPAAAEHFARLEAAGAIDGIGEEVSATIPEVWAVYVRYGAAERWEADSIPEALSFLRSGEDNGDLSSWGVVVDGEAHTVEPYLKPHPPDEGEARELMAVYHRAVAQEARDEAYFRTRGREG